MKSEQKNFGKIGKTLTSSAYIEELYPSDTFRYLSQDFVLTQDYKKNSHRMAVCLNDGCSRWFDPSTTVERLDLYSLNNDGHIIALSKNQTYEQTN